MAHRYHLIARFLILTAVITCAVSSRAMAQAYRWRRDSVVVNANSDPLEVRRNEVRFKDWLKKFSVSETSFSIHFRDQDRDYVAWDVTMTASFTAPAVVITSGEKVTLKASIVGSGHVAEGRPGIIFQYNSRGISLRGEKTLAGGFEGSSFKGGSIEPYFEAPKATRDGEFRIYASLWNERPCNVMWIYRCEPIPTVPQDSNSDPSGWQKGELVGHIVGMTGGVMIVRGEQYIEAWEGIPVFAGDRIITTDNGRARLSTFLVGAKEAWEKTIERLKANHRYIMWEEELGTNWHTRIPYPTPNRENIDNFVKYLSDGPRRGLGGEYLKTVHTWGHNFDIGVNSEIGVEEITGGCLTYLRKGILRIFRDTSLGQYININAAEVCIPLQSDNPQRQTTDRWSQLDEEEREMYKEAFERNRRLYEGLPGAIMEFFGKPGFILRPKGTDFAVEYAPSAGSVVIGVKEGQVECLDVQSGQVATLVAGEAVRSANGQGGTIVSLTDRDWGRFVSTTGPPEQAGGTVDWTGSDVSFLNGSVTSIRMFESGRDLTAYERRKYEDTFVASQARYICWELQLAFPRPNSRIEFEIGARYHGSDGKLLFNQTHNSHILADWTTSIHSRGWGSDQPGFWKPGRYRVDICVNEQVVGSRQFEVTGQAGQLYGNSGDGTVSGTIPLIQAKVNVLKFFESEFNTPPANEWIFANSFSRAGTRYIYWALFFEYPAQGRRVDFKIDSVWYRPDGSVLARQVTPTYVEPQWTSSNCSNGWGAMIPGTFMPGTYRVELSVDGKPIASGVFEIMD